jgi:hypothetical protein
MSKYFDINTLKDSATPDIASGVAEKFMTVHESKIDSIKNIMKLPEPGEIYFLLTENSFNAFTFILYIIRQFKVIDRLIISTYSINQRIIESLMRYFHKGCIKEIFILVSDSLKFRMPKVVDVMESLVMAYSNIKIHYSWNHSKVTLMQCGNDHFVMEGSGNWSENSRYEQYVFLNNEKVFNFRRECIYGVR